MIYNYIIHIQVISKHLATACNIHILVPRGRKLPGPAHPAGNTPPRIDFLPHRRDASPWFPCKPVLNALNALRRHQLPNRLQIVELEPPCWKPSVCKSGVQASKIFKPADLVFEGSFLLFSPRHFCCFFRGVQLIPAGNRFLLRKTGNVRHQPFQPSRTGGGTSQPDTCCSCPCPFLSLLLKQSNSGPWEEHESCNWNGGLTIDKGYFQQVPADSKRPKWEAGKPNVTWGWNTSIWVQLQSESHDETANASWHHSLLHHCQLVFQLVYLSEGKGSSASRKVKGPPNIFSTSKHIQALLLPQLNS